DIGELVSQKPQWQESASLREVFKDIPSLYELHKHLLNGLERVHAENFKNLLPSIFVKMEEVPYLNIYKIFVCRYADNYTRLARLVSKDKDFSNLCKSTIESSKFAEQRIQDVCGMYFGVHSSLTRFKLLISKLEETLREDDSRLLDVQRALKVISELLQNSEGEMVRQDKIKDAQMMLSKIDGRTMEFRQIPPLIREGPCRKIPRRSTHKRILDRHLFLFAGYLVITEPVNAIGRYQTKSETILSGATLSEISEDEEIGIPHCFRIRAQHLCVELAFVSAKEKEEWWDGLLLGISHASTHVNSLGPTADQELEVVTGSTAAEWVKDEQSTMCAECHTQFTVINRRHHCRVCGKVFCGSCSDYRAPIRFLGGKLKRVCVVDYYLIHQELKPPTPAIMESILRRTQKGSASTETGYLFWCVCSQGVWNSKPASRSIRTTSQTRHIRLHLIKSPSNVVTSSSTSSGCPQDQDNSNCPVRCDSLNVDTTSTNSDSSLQMTPESSTKKSNTKASAGIHVHPHHSVCLSRMSCVLQTDTLLSMFAARADTKAKDQIPLIGTRLFFLDTISCAPSPELYCRKRSASCVVSKKPDFTPEVDSYKALKESRSDRTFKTDSHSTSDLLDGLLYQPANPSDEFFNNDRPLNLNPSTRRSNPFYRNCKPPFLLPKPNTASIATVTGKCTQQAVCKDEPIDSPPSPLYIRTRTSPTLENGLVNTRAERPRRGRTVLEERRKTKFLAYKEYIQPTFTREEVAKQIESISPSILGILRNKLGFILLPMNTDSLAHYFEAPSEEVRTRWLLSICRTCINYMAQWSSEIAQP
ncbi:hypothetical protein PHET_05899, partial [Paragonimus heterotremus]